MSNPTARKLVERITSLSRKVAAQAQTVTLGTVLSRNPDGSLNVSDGKGGCARVVPKANVRIGSQIAIGIEPAIGQQTNLQTQFLTIEPSSVPCPNDDGGGEICPPGLDCTEEFTIAAALQGNIFSVQWNDFSPPTFADLDDGDWNNRLNGGHDSLRGGPTRGDVDAGAGIVRVQTSRRTGAYPSTEDGDEPYANQLKVGAERSFVSFDTSDVSDGVISAVTLRLLIYGNEPAFVPDDLRESIVVVPSDHDGDPDNLTNFDKVDETILGEIAIADIDQAGPDPPENPVSGYNVDIPLDLELVEPLINRNGTTRFALLIKRDALVNSTLPHIGIFGGLEVTESTPTPNANANIAAGTYDLAGATYVPGSFIFAIPQDDRNGGVLSPGESYYLAIVFDGTGTPSLVKGEKGTSPKKPPTPPGGLNIAWVLCRQAGVTIILESDISGFNTARNFTGVNVNEVKTDESEIFTKEDTLEIATQLLITFSRRRAIH